LNTQPCCRPLLGDGDPALGADAATSGAGDGLHPNHGTVGTAPGNEDRRSRWWKSLRQSRQRRPRARRLWRMIFQSKESADRHGCSSVQGERQWRLGDRRGERRNRALAAAGAAVQGLFPKCRAPAPGRAAPTASRPSKRRPFSLSANGVDHFDSVILHSSELGPASFEVRTGLW
jgi:hypothetical protein